MKNRRFHHRLGFAISGIISTLRTENSFRTQVLAAIAIVASLAWLRPDPLWWAIVALTIAVVLAAELLNTAIERLADHVHPERHPDIKLVKDCAAAAVLIASLGALCVALALVLDALS
jgi:diacylglycerol kinase (ATP)